MVVMMMLYRTPAVGRRVVVVVMMVVMARVAAMLRRLMPMRCAIARPVLGSHVTPLDARWHRMPLINLDLDTRRHLMPWSMIRQRLATGQHQQRRNATCQ